MRRRAPGGGGRAVRACPDGAGRRARADGQLGAPGGFPKTLRGPAGDERRAARAAAPDRVDLPRRGRGAGGAGRARARRRCVGVRRRSGHLELPGRVSGGRSGALRADPETIVSLAPDLVCVAGLHRVRCAPPDHRDRPARRAVVALRFLRRRADGDPPARGGGRRGGARRGSGRRRRGAARRPGTAARRRPAGARPLLRSADLHDGPRHATGRDPRRARAARTSPRSWA